jgi:CRISPR-associated endonuclease/helicase Cas3
VHLENVAGIASSFAEAFHARDWVRLGSLWHDLGKYSVEFQRYLLSGGRGSLGPFVKVDHSTAGAQHAARELPLFGALLAYGIAGHHAGLPNGRDGLSSCLEARLAKEIPSYLAAPKFILAAPDVAPMPPGHALVSGYDLGFFLRMAFSALVDADRLDTEAYMSPGKSSLRAKSIPSLQSMLDALNAHLARFGEGLTSVNRARADVLSSCRAAACMAPGLFSLTVPTGGAKTLSSLAFALEHAIRHGMERVIYVLPFTTIIEQNAAVFREVFAALGPDVVIEHHSNLDADGEQQSVTARLATENWDARLIVTTNVQFFETLHEANPSRCRKLHRISRSVVVLDEAQTIPLTLLKPCLRALQTLTGTDSHGRSNYGTSVVLCTATMPAVEQRDEFPCGLRGVREIIPNPGKLFSLLRRVRVTDLGPFVLSDIDLAKRLAGHHQVLCIVNTRRHAAKVFQLLPADGTCFHLSALMCAAHRSAVLGDRKNPAPGTIRYALLHGLPCRVVSTQLIEAGVDISFPAVYRARAGLDSAAQAAGRCNREGLLEALGDLYIFMPESPLPSGFLGKAADATAEILSSHSGDPLSLAAIRAYFRLHYWKNESQMDANGILDCFPRRLSTKESLLDLRFRDCAEKFQFIETDNESVIVPYDDQGRRLISTLRETEDPAKQRYLARCLQRYVVQVPSFAVQSHRGGSIRLLQERFLVLTDEHLYSDELGLQLPSSTASSATK